jgi:hypothetical protein
MLDTWRSGGVPADTTFDQWDRHCRTVTLEHELSEWRRSVGSSSTLRNLYARIKEYPHTEAFMDDPVNRRGRRLKLRLRSGVLRLNAFTARMAQRHRNDPESHCRLCAAGAIEDADHFLLRCTALRAHREVLFNVISDRLSDTAFRDLVPRLTALPGDELICVLAGGSNCTPSDTSLNDATSDMTVQSVIDRAFRNFLRAAWRTRTAVCGRTVFDYRNGRLTIYSVPSDYVDVDDG